MQFTSIDRFRRGPNADTPQRLPVNPILDALRDIDDPTDPWGDAIQQQGAIFDVMSMSLEWDEEITRDISAEFEYVVNAIGFGIAGHGEDKWPTLVETTFYDPWLRRQWLQHAYAVTDRRESFARLLGLDY